MVKSASLFFCQFESYELMNQKLPIMAMLTQEAIMFMRMMKVPCTADEFAIQSVKHVFIFEPV